LRARRTAGAVMETDQSVLNPPHHGVNDAR
jgi:hypothetical protein